MSELLNNLNDEQKNAVTYTKGHLLIIAGAGTGKTTVVTQRINQQGAKAMFDCFFLFFV